MPPIQSKFLSDLSDLSIVRILDELFSWKNIIAFLLISESKEKIATPYGELSYLNGRVVLKTGSSTFLISQKISDVCCLQNAQGNQQNLKEVYVPVKGDIMCNKIPTFVFLSFLEKSKLDDMSASGFWELFTVLEVPMSFKELMKYRIVKSTETAICPGAPFKEKTVLDIQEPQKTSEMRISGGGEEKYDGPVQESPKASKPLTCPDAPLRVGITTSSDVQGSQRRILKAKKQRTGEKDKENRGENLQLVKGHRPMKRVVNDDKDDPSSKRMTFEME